MIFVTNTPHPGGSLSTASAIAPVAPVGEMPAVADFLLSDTILACPLRKGELLDDSCEACQ